MGVDPRTGSPTHTIYTYVVCRVNKRLGIHRFETGERVYVPPDFIKFHSRQPLIELADTFNSAQIDPVWEMIDSIMAFEAEHHPLISRGRHRGAPRVSGDGHAPQAEALEEAARRVS